MRPPLRAPASGNEPSDGPAVDDNPMKQMLTSNVKSREYRALESRESMLQYVLVGQNSNPPDDMRERPFRFQSSSLCFAGSGMPSRLRLNTCGEGPTVARSLLGGHGIRHLAAIQAASSSRRHCH
eukprot:6214342-Pleurochrysis_carterae.AAC.4